MRLTEQEQYVIKDTIQGYDADARVLLFGSRVDPSKKGGDIDLLVISGKLRFADKLEILADLHQKLGEQKVDVLLDKDGNGDFARTVMPTAVEL